MGKVIKIAAVVGFAALTFIPGAPSTPFSGRG